MPEIESCCLWGLPAKIFLLCVLQHWRQGEIAVVVAQNQDEFDPASALAMAALRRPLAPMTLWSSARR
jgi:DNA-directed RNA polymerase specialized sigma24 family protein